MVSPLLVELVCFGTLKLCFAFLRLSRSAQNGNPSGVGLLDRR
jgi:hypothetical protein